MANKLIAIPYERYESLLARANANKEIFQKEEKESSQGEAAEEMARGKGKSKVSNLKKATQATLKAQEMQELIQRKREYKDVGEELPKTLDKPLRQTAATLLPPPHLREKPKKPAKKPPKKAAAKSVHNGIGPWKFTED